MVLRTARVGLRVTPAQRRRCSRGREAGAGRVTAVRKHRARERKLQARQIRRVRQAQHEAAKTVISWAVERRIGTLVVGDPRGVLDLEAGRRHDKRLRDWRVGYLAGDGRRLWPRGEVILDTDDVGGGRDPRAAR